MTSVRMHEELESRSARLGTIRNIIRLVGSDLAPEPLFDAVVQEIRRVVECQRCAIGWRDPATGRHHYWHVASDIDVEPLRDEAGEGWEGAVVYRSRQPFYIADLSNVEVTTRQRLLAAGLRSTLLVPVVRNGECIAHFSLSSTRPHAFSTEDIVLLGEISDCLASAIRNATLYRQSRESAERLEVARNIAHAVASTLDPQLLFRVIAGHIRRAVACERCDIARIDAEDDDARRLPRTPVYVSDTSAAGDDVDAARLARVGLSSWLMVPVVQEGQCVARIDLVRREANAFSQREIELLESVAHHVAPAIENARLHGEVRRGRDFFQSVFDDSADPMIIVGNHGRIRRSNAASRRVLGYEEEELAGKDMAILMPEERWGEWREFVARRNIDSAFSLDAPVRCCDGSSMPAHVTVSPVVSAIRGVIAFCAIFKDLSERDVLMKKLEAKSAEMERFTYGVAHDLKSPLITIKGFVGAVRESLEDGEIEPALADLDRIAGAAERMQALLNDLLSLARVGRIDGACADVPLTEVVDEALDLIEGPLAERGVAVRVTGELPVVYGDRQRLRELVQNLVENAIKFSGDEAHPEIEIGATTVGHERVFYVRDNGIGIDPRRQDEAFDVCQRLGRSEEGSGIGLAMVKQIVECHGGRVWVESAGDGHGSTFKFTLPTRGD